MDERDKSPVPLLHSATKIPLPWRGARKGGVVAYRHNKLSKHKSLKDRNSIGGNHPGALRHPSTGGE